MRMKRLGLVCVALVALPLGARADVALTDASGLEYFIVESRTYDTAFSASAAASEASFTGAVMATTEAGGAQTTTLTDAFDGYGTVALSFAGTVPAEAPVVGPDYVFYNDTGALTDVDPAVCGGRELHFPTQEFTAPSGTTMDMTRRVFVPSDDEFVRWLTIIEHTAGDAVTFHVGGSHDLGSDELTTLTDSSSGDTLADTTDTWVTSMEGYAAGESYDVRLGHIFQGAGSPAAPVASLDFTDGNDVLYWWYTITLNPGETAAIMYFATGQPTKAEAATQAAAVAGLEGSTLDCIDTDLRPSILNFEVAVCPGAPDGTVCDDDNPCTVDDSCTGGVCGGDANACDDADACTADSCDPDTGCANDPIDDCVSCTTDDECDDGAACNGAETCDTGACAAGEALVCEDDDDCTTDSCDDGSGCVFDPIDDCGGDGGMPDGGTDADTPDGGDDAGSDAATDDAGSDDAGPVDDAGREDSSVPEDAGDTTGGTTGGTDSDAGITTSSDGGGVDGGGGDNDDDGCGCRVPTGRSSTPLTGLLGGLVLGALVIARRRRRR